MAEDFVVRVSFDDMEPASPSLQNCIKFSNSGRYFSALCDFGAVSICQLTGTSEINFGNKIRVPLKLRGTLVLFPISMQLDDRNCVG